ncbi:Leu/Phe/Val dehydrogenase [Pararhizobium haloflavum]|uniref:Leu/Phe/Val dehydrogenase n=1 Tax=Pararhizobium haloflavum TaxID=2037914 RepID=UPI000C1984E8|nr:Glu/Leu/Phe/Val dehydrogenase dimerization domain-containing protein [Pararhizobium haloflavum]
MAGAISSVARNRVAADSTLIVEDITASAARHHAYAGHETVLLGRDDERGLTAIIAIHSTRLGPAIGGTRIWAHPHFDDALADVLRLSEGMTHKAAVAGLPHGGGKAVIIANPKRQKTTELFDAYAEMLGLVAERYFTAEDVGLTLADADYLKARTPNVLGTTRGGSKNPSPVTAFGVFLGIKSSVRHRLGKESVDGLTVAVQGLGAVGVEVARLLVDEGARLIVSDIDPERVDRAVKAWGARLAEPDDILAMEADVLAPCALGGGLNAQSIPMVRAQIVAGAANNQLATVADAERLAEAGILYAPDYVINAGGLLNVAGELASGGYDRDRVFSSVRAIPETLATIFRRAEEERTSTEAIARVITRERLSMADGTGRPG